MDFTLSCIDLNYEIGDRRIIEDLNISFRSGERIALIGNNGAGKTTFLRIISSEIGDFTGRITGLRNKSIGYLQQDCIELNDDITVYKVAERYLKQTTDHWELYHGDLIKNLHIMGFSSNDIERNIQEFSGGYKMRAVFAGLISANPDILLLDEVENHIDQNQLKSIVSYLLNFKGILVFVSHNRDFINRVASSIVEIQSGKFLIYPGNFDKYLVLKKNKDDWIEKLYVRQQERIKKLKKFIAKNIANKKTASQAHAREKEINRMEMINDPVKTDKKVKIDFEYIPSQPAVLLNMKNIYLAYNDNVVMRGGELSIERNDKIAFICPNGSGKTSLINVITGNSVANTKDTIIEMNDRTKIGIFSQEAEKIDSGMKVIDFVGGIFPDRSREICGRFLFNDDDVNKVISVLSGGERARLNLIKLISQSANLLLLDEPTNHLDLNTIAVFRGVLSDFPGAIVLVSHNEELFTGLVNKVFTIDNRIMKMYSGDYEYVRDKHLNKENDDKIEYTITKKDIRVQRLNMRRDIDRITKEIEDIEEKLFEIELELENKTNIQGIRKKILRKEQFEKKIDALIIQRTDLENELEGI